MGGGLGRDAPRGRAGILEVRPRIDAVRLRQEVEDDDCGQGNQEDDEAGHFVGPFLERFGTVN